MQTTTCMVVGVFDDYNSAQRAVNSLKSSAFRDEQITVSSTQTGSGRTDWGTSTAARTSRDTDAGGISGFFRRLVGADDDETIYAEAVRRGNVVVTVETDESKQDLAADIMNEFGAVDIDRRAASWAESGYSGAAAGARTGYPNETGTRSIPVVKEEISIGKRAVQRGGVRVYSRLMEEPVEESVNLREEHVRVDRRAADRPATEADIRGQNEVIEVTEMAEEPVVEKRARVVEEVVVSKQATQKTAKVREKVRRTDVNVEPIATPAITGYDEDFRRDFSTRFGTDRSATYETYAPAYEYGYRMASDQRFKGRSWDEVESTLKTDYERNNPNSAWERTKGAVRYGWEKVTGRR